MNAFSTTSSRRTAAAFTLLEVILALAILAGSVAILGEVLRLASRNAADARGETYAQILATSKMDEILSGMVEREDVTRQPLDVEDATAWLYSVTLTETEFEGITSIEVLVEQELEPQFHPARYRLVRWAADAESSSTDPSDTSDSTGS